MASRAKKLSKTMTFDQFQNGYWYAVELKKFAEEIGIPSAGKLRKDELEKAILSFLQKGKVERGTKRSLQRTGVKDVELGLDLKLPVVNYTNDTETKTFIETEALKLSSHHRRRSGARYRLNRWREEQLTKGTKITYGDLIRQYVELNKSEEPFKKIPTGRYINFLSEFLAAETNATRQAAIDAWHQLKRLDIPKTYKAWTAHQFAAKRGKRRGSNQ
jgi:hypothetical protein